MTKPSVTVYTIAYNEEVMLQFMIDHYRTRFSDCRIVIYNNMSTDNTVKIALANYCEVRNFDTGNQLQDQRHMDIKNSCWKDAKTDWVLVSDLDELLDINETELEKEQDGGTTIIRSEGYDMVNMEDNLNIAGIKHGLRDPVYDKTLLFNKKFIAEINYTIGSHGCNPMGRVMYSKTSYKLFHYLLINETYTIKKHKAVASRLSPENLMHGWGYHYFQSSEDVHDEYIYSREYAIKIR